VERARAWYSEILGLEPVNPDDEELLYRVAGTQFGIYPSDHAGTNQATAVRFVVSDFDAVRVELLSKGVVFEDYDLGERLPDCRRGAGVPPMGRRHRGRGFRRKYPCPRLLPLTPLRG
jgi:catechol 2,3-dioxygenase-like lactoylglutathione lyase family enzyme